MNLEDILAIDTTPIDEGMVYDISKIWVSTYVSSHLSVENGYVFFCFTGILKNLLRI